MNGPQAREASPQFNLSLSLGSLLSLPSRFIARIRKIDDILNQDLENHALATTAAAQAQGLRNGFQTRGGAENIHYELVAMPGPLAFLTSGYAIGLLAMTILLNRIQHIVVPPRRSMALRVLRSRRSIFHAFFYSVFPIDLSSTKYRMAFRIPSLYLLFKSLALFTVVLLQVSDLYPSWNFWGIQALGEWVEDKETADICWTTFCAVCLSLVIGSLTRGLEGHHNNSGSPFNLFGYAMLLHIYSVPLTHPNKGPPSRPDKNVIITIVLPLLQLTMIHFLGIKKRWSRQRLVPTTICSLLTLLHFNFVLFTRPSSYPLLNYLPSLLETLLLVVTLLTCTLNILTQLLLEGEVRRPLFGHSRSLSPKLDEDFSVVLLRLGTASLEATNVAGLGNELGSVAVGESDSLAKINAEDEGVVELNNEGVISVGKSKKGKGRAGGFGNEIKNVKVNPKEGDWMFDYALLREFIRFSLSLWAVMKGTARLFLWIIWYRWRGSHLIMPTEAVRAKSREHSSTRKEPTGVREAVSDDYSRFLHGERISDDEDEYVPPVEMESSNSEESDAGISSEEGEESEGGIGDSEDISRGAETAGLYSDLLESTTTNAQTHAPVFVAHMTAQQNSPLTRRRYNRLVTNPRHRALSPMEDDEGDLWQDFIQERRGRAFRAAVMEGDSDAVGGSRSCVICTTEPRDIICWPCRCLAMCDDCRENLASRFAASKHSCPCCRRSVEGYSRIYLP